MAARSGHRVRRTSHARRMRRTHSPNCSARWASSRHQDGCGGKQEFGARNAAGSAPAVRRTGLSGDQESGPGIFACDQPRDPPMDRPEGLAYQGTQAARVRSTRGLRRGRGCGLTGSRSLGSYIYDKRLVEKHTTVPCEVKLYPMRVRWLETVWPEQAERERRWFSPPVAIAAVSDDGLKVIIENFVNGRQLGSGSSKGKSKSKAKPPASVFTPRGDRRRWLQTAPSR